jgi:hypothetical protein
MIDGGWYSKALCGVWPARQLAGKKLTESHHKSMTSRAGVSEAVRERWRLQTLSHACPTRDAPRSHVPARVARPCCQIQRWHLPSRWPQGWLPLARPPASLLGPPRATCQARWAPRPPVPRALRWMAAGPRCRKARSQQCHRGGSRRTWGRQERLVLLSATSLTKVGNRPYDVQIDDFRMRERSLNVLSH